jgi:predicted Ser/Thr protein kinase
MNAPAQNTPDISDIIPGFQIRRELARGGMATVYLATQLSLDRTVALKVLRAFENPDHKTRFFNESRIIGSLNHRNIITIFDVGSAVDQAFLSMEYLDGGDLSTRIEKGPLDPCEALEIAAAIGDCLAFVHEQGIVHRDVKPANILFHYDGTPVLTDFGIATDTNIDAKLTACGTTVGSPCYVSPEQAQGLSVDGRTDIYSLGSVLYEMLVGRPPFQESSAVETMAAHITLPPLALPEHLRDCQPLIDRMLAKDPGDRFSSATDMVNAIRDLQINMDGPATAPRQTFIPFVFQGLSPHIRTMVTTARAWVDDLQDKATLTRLSGFSAPIIATAIVIVAAGLFAVAGLGDPEPVRAYLQQAEVAFDEDRLSYPKAGSASYFYREVLRLDPEHDDALEGLHDIAEIYADRSERDLQSKNFSSAKFNLVRGLEVERTNERLLKLQQETKALRTLPEKVVNGIRSIFD